MLCLFFGLDMDGDDRIRDNRLQRRFNPVADSMVTGDSLIPGNNKVEFDEGGAARLTGAEIVSLNGTAGVA